LELEFNQCQRNEEGERKVRKEGKPDQLPGTAK
jgi:hypothetical protein